MGGVRRNVGGCKASIGKAILNSMSEIPAGSKKLRLQLQRSKEPRRQLIALSPVSAFVVGEHRRHASTCATLRRVVWQIRRWTPWAALQRAVLFHQDLECPGTA